MARNLARFGGRATPRLALLLLLTLALITGGVGSASAVDDEGIYDDIETESGDTVDGPTAAGEPVAEKSHGVEEIRVSGKQRSQNLQVLPESISSFSGSDILDKGLTNFNDLQFNVPSLFSGGGLTRITLRGVGSEIVGPGIDPGFAVHVNSVFSARETTGLLDYFDVARVDVYRGPQGTLWGRNSTGGAMNIVTNKAVHEFDANADAEYSFIDGGANGMRLRGMINMPLVEDKLALRVAGLANFNDGNFLVESPEHKQRLNDAATATLRASLHWDASDDVTVDFIGGWFQSRGDGGGQKFAGEYKTPDDQPGFRNVWAGAGPGIDFQDAADQYEEELLANPKDPYKGTADEPQRSNAQVWTATILAAWQMEEVKLDSITGYQSTDFFIHQDQDTSSLPISTLELTDESRQISQEFLLNSTWDRPYNFTVGTIYQYDWTPQTRVQIRNTQDGREAENWLLLPSLFLTEAGGALFDIDAVSITLVDGCPAGTPPPLDVPAFGIPYANSCPDIKELGDPYAGFIDALTEADNHVFGLYGNFSWELIEDLTLQVGGRYSYTYRDWNDKTVAQTYAPAFSNLGLQILQRGVPLSGDWSAGTWKVSVDYDLLDDHLLWTSVGTGSRAGGFNFSEESSFGAEFILAVEAGVKNRFFDNRLIFNITGFWYDWDNPQIAAVENALPVTVNAPSATSYGVEFDFRARPVDDLELSGSFGWLEAFYDEHFISGDQSEPDLTQISPADRVNPVDLNGNRMPRSPRFTASFGIQYTFDLGRWGTVIPRVDFYYRDEIAFRQFNNPKDLAPSYTRTDARLIWRSQSGQFWGELFARNLENEAVRNNQQILASIYRVHNYSAPINGGFRVGYYYQ